MSGLTLSLATLAHRAHFSHWNMQITNSEVSDAVSSAWHHTGDENRTAQRGERDEKTFNLHLILYSSLIAIKHRSNVQRTRPLTIYIRWELGRVGNEEKLYINGWKWEKRQQDSSEREKSKLFSLYCSREFIPTFIPLWDINLPCMHVSLRLLLFAECTIYVNKLVSSAALFLSCR